MNRASAEKRILQFKKPAGTSRGVLTEKISWYITVEDEQTGKKGFGECSILPGLSPESFSSDFENVISESVKSYNRTGQVEIAEAYPALRFAWEAALLDLSNGGSGVLFPSDFTAGKKGIDINGLVWMGSEEEMLRQVDEKVAAGFRCIKLKIGALDFETELRILSSIREKYPDIELRLDANGAFAPSEALSKLNRLAAFNIHSIEQPIKAGQPESMMIICKESPIPVALDEELIGIYGDKRAVLLDKIKPKYIILKPSLLSGFSAADEWIRIAEERNIAWWATSALESNVGLSAIAQWVGAKKITMLQGLGTGELFENNTSTSTEIRSGKLYFLPRQS
jgi:o-succinylbenzoate synthase